MTQLTGQKECELKPFAELLAREGVRSYLEIGSRYGDAAYYVMTHLPKGSRCVCVDLPGSAWGADSLSHLEIHMKRLRDLGYDARTIIGDSAWPDVLAKVAALGPYDAAFIDADHRYQAVKRDFENYKAPITGFHDIDGDGMQSHGMPVEVPRLWRELKPHHRHVEFVDDNRDLPMGIGVLWT